MSDEDKPEKKVRPVKTGVPITIRRGRSSIALTFQGRVLPEVHALYLETIMAGKCPMLVRNEARTLTNGWWVEPDESFNAPVPTLAERMRAQEIYLARGYGMPAQHVQIDAEVRQLSGTSLVMDPRIMQQTFAPRDFKELRNTLNRLGKPQEEILDAEFTDKPVEPEAFLEQANPKDDPKAP